MCIIQRDLRDVTSCKKKKVLEYRFKQLAILIFKWKLYNFILTTHESAVVFSIFLSTNIIELLCSLINRRKAVQLRFYTLFAWTIQEHYKV